MEGSSLSNGLPNCYGYSEQVAGLAVTFDFRAWKIFFEFGLQRLPGFFRVRRKKAVVHEYFERLSIERYRHFFFETITGCERGLVCLRETRLKKVPSRAALRL